MGKKVVKETKLLWIKPTIVFAVVFIHLKVLSRAKSFQFYTLFYNAEILKIKRYVIIVDLDQTWN